MNFKQLLYESFKENEKLTNKEIKGIDFNEFKFILFQISEKLNMNLYDFLHMIDLEDDKLVYANKIKLMRTRGGDKKIDTN